MCELSLLRRYGVFTADFDEYNISNSSYRIWLPKNPDLDQGGTLVQLAHRARQLVVPS